MWLEQFGYPRPTADRVEIGLGYSSRRYRLRPGALGDDLAILTAPTPGNPRAGGVAPLERGLHIVTLGGILGDHPPLDPAGFDAFAASVCFPDVAEALVGATPVDEAVPFRFPASVRYRYERLRRFPAGLLVIGDAVCSFNPIYGQGMTVAAMEAATLRDVLRNGSPPAPHRYFRRIVKVIDTPWVIVVGADLAFPDVPGRRSTKTRMVNAYLPRLHAAASTDSSLARAFIRVVGMGRQAPRAAPARSGTAGPVGTPAGCTGTGPRPVRAVTSRIDPAIGKETEMSEHPAGDLVGPSRAATPPCCPTRTVASGPPIPAPTARSPLSSITYRETVQRPPHAARGRASTGQAR
ncbi:MAG: hypothetical protein WBL53_10240 [Pseudonocardiaceae bacterium]